MRSFDRNVEYFIGYGDYSKGWWDDVLWNRTKRYGKGLFLGYSSSEDTKSEEIASPKIDLRLDIRAPFSN